MSAPFKVGEICVLQNCRIRPENEGREVTITEIGMLSDLGDGLMRFGYKLDFTLPNGRICVAQPHQLRRRKPPTEYKGEQIMQKLIRDTLDKAPMREGEMA